eukprot:m.690021 g.690021  ORF g.690021 m.690021 type:complete len:53 (-) comp22848_c0_seq3:2780-2938(-)
MAERAAPCYEQCNIAAPVARAGVAAGSEVAYGHHTRHDTCVICIDESLRILY